MPATESCTPCCAETQTINVPGVEGEAGTNGEDGENAYTVTTTASLVIPAVGSTVTVAVESTAWMVAGQVVVIAGPATFRVTTISNATSVILTFLGASGDLSPSATIAAGAGVTPGGAPGSVSTLSVYGAGSAYALTATSALLNLGTTPPSLTITAAGTYLIFARVRYDYLGATFAASRTVTTKLTRTNNTPADLTNGTSAWLTDIITTLTYTAQFQVLPPITYTTANTNDIIQLWGAVSVVPTAGSLSAVECEIVAIKIA